MSFWTYIDSIDDLRNAINGIDTQKPFSLILKHSTRCAISSMAKNRLERNGESGVHYFIIDIIANRSVSNALTEESNVQHESPQSFLYASGGALLDVRSHMAIDAGEISRRLQMISRI
jgi:bacillithiol system protein YtxJ